MSNQGKNAQRIPETGTLVGGMGSDGKYYHLAVGTDGAIAVSATSEMAAEATAAAPTYTETQNAPLSQDLTGNLRTKDTAANAALGTTAGAAVITDANGTLQQYLRGIIKLAITAGGWLTSVQSIKGAANLASSQVTSTGTAATLAAARATRRSVLFTNKDTTGTVWIGPATVTSSNGQILGPGQSCSFTWVGLFQVIDDTADHCIVSVLDEYD
jgi:hypothetical protein